MLTRCLMLIALMTTMSSVARAHEDNDPLNPLGLYVGAAGGTAQLRVTEPNLPAPFEHHDLGWKVMAGIRPLPLLGVEAQYVDFGSASGFTAAEGVGGQNFTERIDTHAKAAALFAVAYVPFDWHSLEGFAKAGAAELRSRTTAQTSVSCPICLKALPTNIDTGEMRSTHLAYGVGLQKGLGSLRLRLEYERISASSGDPDLLSLGLLWTY